MKKSGMALGLGALIVLIGLFVMIKSLHLGDETMRFDIAAGSQNYNRIRIDLGLLSGAGLSGSHSVDDGSSISLYILTESNYEDYARGGAPHYIVRASGSSGTFETVLDTGGTYFIVLEHGSGYANNRQTGSVSFRITGTNVIWLTIGVVMLVAGLVLASYGVMLLKRASVKTPDLPIRTEHRMAKSQDSLEPAKPSQKEDSISKPPQVPP